MFNFHFFDDCREDKNINICKQCSYVRQGNHFVELNKKSSYDQCVLNNFSLKKTLQKKFVCKIFIFIHATKKKQKEL